MNKKLSVIGNADDYILFFKKPKGITEMIIVIEEACFLKSLIGCWLFSMFVNYKMPL